jgi:hypothetical protein
MERVRRQGLAAALSPKSEATPTKRDLELAQQVWASYQSRHSDADLHDAARIIAIAREEERERCAKIVDRELACYPSERIQEHIRKGKSA